MNMLTSRRRGYCKKVDRIMTNKTNSPVLSICKAKNWCASSKYMTKKEAEAVTNISNVFKSKTSITHFEEFQYFTGVTSLPGSVNQGAFESCSNLQRIVLPNSLLSIGARAFEHCTKLAYLDIPASCTSINTSYTFYNTSPSLTLNFNNDSTYYYKASYLNARYFTSSLSNLDYDGMLIYNTILVACPLNKIAPVIIPNNITTLGKQCFVNYSKIEDLIIPDTVTNIQSSENASTDGAFYKSAFKSIIFSKNITNIPQRTLYIMANLEYLVLPMSSLTIHSTYNFSSVGKLKIIWVSPSIKSVVSGRAPSSAEVKDIPEDWDGTLEDLLSREEQS